MPQITFIQNRTLSSEPQSTASHHTHHRTSMEGVVGDAAGEMSEGFFTMHPDKLD